MSDKKEQAFNFESSGLISYIDYRKKPLLIVIILTIIVSSIVSLLIEPKFKSTVILFPASSSSISQQLLTERNNKKDLLKFGEEEDVEQLMQVIQSDDIRDKIIQRFNLYEHYEIDSTKEEYPKTRLHKEFKENISFIRTEYMSIKVEVLDKNPITASKIANEIAAMVDTVMNTMKKERAVKGYNLVKREYLALKKHIDFLKDSLTVLQKKGIFHYESQAEVFNDAYAVALSEGRMKGAKMIEEKLGILAEYGSSYTIIRDMLIYETEKLTQLESKLIEAEVDVKQDLPYKYIVSRGVPAEKKSYPIRWLIVVVSTISSFILALIILTILDNVKKKRKEQMMMKQV